MWRTGDHRCGSGTACLPSTCEALSLIHSTAPTRKQTWDHKVYGQNSSIVIRKGSVFEFPTCFNRAAMFYGKNVLILSLFWQVFKSFSSLPILSVSIFLCLSVSFSLNFRRSLWRYSAEYHEHWRQGCYTEENKSQKRKDEYMGTCFPQTEFFKFRALEEDEKTNKVVHRWFIDHTRVGNWNITM